MVPRFLYPLLPYRSLLLPFLVVSAIVVPGWLLFRLYRHRTAGRETTLKREIVLLTFVVYLSGLGAATLLPNDSARMREVGVGGVELRPNAASLTCMSPSMPEGSSSRGFCMRNARGNVVLFVPLGILIPLVWPQIGFWIGMQSALAASLGIELVQYLSSAWGSYRAADVNDVILNVVGAGLGLLLVVLVRWRPGVGDDSG